eukprot:CAMPEP_0172892422 /NCGR_PEP_ID=MMETSP1075-20121228/146151_1 /TAXON_ID=2916 /ORGANISM="Ceratium fusus, Strain PA161109" /LENGTH=129 /DNA_ID=CAMNT_0013747067 /DNA_START=128 /DNA_END=517 /DNA_ORIENTATION=-
MAFREGANECEVQLLQKWCESRLAVWLRHAGSKGGVPPCPLVSHTQFDKSERVYEIKEFVQPCLEKVKLVVEKKCVDQQCTSSSPCSLLRQTPAMTSAVLLARYLLLNRWWRNRSSRARGGDGRCEPCG